MQVAGYECRRSAMKKKLVQSMVTTNKQAALHRQSTEAAEDELYKTLANNLQLGVYIAVDKRLQFTNFHLQEYTGYSRAEMMDMDPLDLVHPDDRDKAVIDASNMIKGLRFSPYEYRLLSKDGETRWILETVVPIMFKGKKAVLGNSLDITEYKSAKVSLQEFDALKASILDAIPHAVVGLENRRINFANTAVEEVFGWKPEELIGKSVTLFYRNEKEAEDDRPALLQHIGASAHIRFRIQLQTQRRQGYPVPDEICTHRR